jgi:hypothetical protein
MQKLITRRVAGALLIFLAIACENPVELSKKETSSPQEIIDEEISSASVQLRNYSQTPALLKKLSGFEKLEVYSIISSEDTLPSSPACRFGGSADGAGLLKTKTGYSIIVNHEDNFAVSRISLNASFRPKKGEYILNSDGGKWRLCSATMVTPDEHGFGPIFLTCGESGEESRTHAINPLADAADASLSRELEGLGRWSAENAVPLPKTAFSGKTVILVGDDDSDTHGGQLAMYVSATGDLENGKLYVMRRADLNTRERDIVEGSAVPVEFVEVQNQKTLTGAQINAEATALHSISFGRVEDIDYRKGGSYAGREVYFNVTGQNNTGVNADYSRSKYGRVYKLVLDPASPFTGTLELALDGDNRTAGAKAAEFQNPDNIMVTENYAYIQEDPNGGYNDQTHDAYVYQYDLSTKELKKVFELDHRRASVDADKFNSVAGSGYPIPVAGKSGYGSWEYGALIDISHLIDIPNTFMLCIQPHTWRSDLFKGVDGGSLRKSENQGSQIVIIKGLPK